MVTDSILMIEQPISIKYYQWNMGIGHLLVFQSAYITGYKGFSIKKTVCTILQSSLTFVRPCMGTKPVL